MSACETRALKVLATRRYPGPAFEELRDAEVGSLSAPRDGVEAVIVANEPVPLDVLPSLLLVANFGVGYDRIDVAACAARGVAVTNTPGVLDAATADLTLALIVAHELGHVLGLDHETGVCATMNPTVGNDHTTLCPTPPSGMWTCRLLQPDDVRGAVKLYGGRVRPWRGSSFCNR